MDNDGLVELVRKEVPYLPGDTERSERVLQAMRIVDRKDFLTRDLVLDFDFVRPEAVRRLQETAQRVLINDGALLHEINLLANSLRSWYLAEPRTDDELFSIDSFEVRRIQKKAVEILGSSPTNDILIKAIDDVFKSLVTSSMLIRELAYTNRYLNIGHGQNCSTPSMVAFMADILELQPGQRVLEVGTGCGYHAAVTAHLINESGLLYTIERIPQLAQLAIRNLEAHFGRDDMHKRVKVIIGDGSIGLQTGAHFDRIYLTAGVEKPINPDTLAGQFAKQLKPDGILLLPERDGRMIKYTSRDGELKPLMMYEGVRFVPLRYGVSN